MAHAKAFCELLQIHLTESLAFLAFLSVSRLIFYTCSATKTQTNKLPKISVFESKIAMKAEIKEAIKSIRTKYHVKTPFCKPRQIPWSWCVRIFIFQIMHSGKVFNPNSFGRKVFLPILFRLSGTLSFVPTTREWENRRSICARQA